MEKDRSRGLKHITDKKKYKGNTTKNPKHVLAKAKIKPNLGSNWDRYEPSKGNESEHALSSSTDFALLASAPLTTGSHRKNADAEPQLFSLNLDLLTRSIEAVPFWQRLGISKEYFEEEKVEEMEERARKRMQTYRAFLVGLHASEEPEDSEEEPEEVAIDDQHSGVRVSELGANSEDLEQWLDGILEH